jgi:ABC-type polysaccharide/polyol phosphate export permease
MKNIRSFFNLSFNIAKCELIIKNEGSIFGIFWYLLNPILTFIFLYSIFYDRLGLKILNYPIYLLIGIIVFNFFKFSLLESVRAISFSYRGILKSINLQKEAFIFAIILKLIFSHLFEIILLCIMMIYFNIPLSHIFYYIIIFLPIIIFVFGVCLIISSINVYIRDFSNILGYFIGILWIITPIFYDISGQTRLYYLNLLNPLYFYITLLREAIILGKINNYLLLFVAVFYSLFYFFTGFYIFFKLKSKFTERI